MNSTERFALVLLTLCLLAGAIELYYAWPSAFKGCGVGSLSEGEKLAIDELRDIVKWGLGIAAAICGVYGSLLLKIKDSPQFTVAGNLLACSVVTCFGFSAYFALLCRKMLIQVLYMDCPDLISTAWVERPFDAFTHFFVGGLALITMTAILTLLPIFNKAMK